MAKKIWYSTPLRFYWNEVYATQKKHTPEFSDKKIFEVLRHNLLSAPLKDGETAEQRELIVSGWELWNQDARGNFLHIFFLEKQLRDFLEKTPLSDLDGIRQYLFENGENKKIVYIKSQSKSHCVDYSFGLHIPHENDGYAFSLSIFENNSIDLYYCRGEFSGHLSGKFYNDLNKKDDHQSLMLSNAFRLAINTIAYMKCFPECVAEGVPKSQKKEMRIDQIIT